MARYQIDGMRELVKTIKTLDSLPQKCVTVAARKGASIPLKAAKKGGWINQTGNLRKGIILKGERTRVKGKKVYEVTLNPAMSDVFAKEHTATSNHSSVLSKKAKKGDRVRSYYPASQEFGFKARNGRYIPGFHYLKKSIDENSRPIERTIVDVLTKEIDKL